MTSQLTLGTAKITATAKGGFVLSYMSHGNFTVGERTYGNVAAAIRFCDERALRVLSAPRVAA